MKLRFLDLLLDTLRLYASLLPLLVAIYLVCVLPSQWLGRGVMGTVLMMGLGSLLHALFLVFCRQKYAGESLQGGAALGLALSRFIPFVLAGWLIALCVGVGTLAFLLPGLFLGVRLALALPVVLFEHLSPDRAMKRSFELTQGRFWLVFRLLALCYLPTFSLVAVSILAVRAPQALSGWQLYSQALGHFAGYLGVVVSFMLYQRLANGTEPPQEEPGIGLNPAS